MTNAALITLCWGLHEQGIPKAYIAQRLGKHRETIRYWLRGIEQLGLLAFLDKYEQAKKGERQRRQVDPIVKRRVWKIREREYGRHLSVPKTYEILSEKYIIRSKMTGGFLRRIKRPLDTSGSNW